MSLAVTCHLYAVALNELGLGEEGRSWASWAARRCLMTTTDDPIHAVVASTGLRVGK